MRSGLISLRRLKIQLLAEVSMHLAKSVLADQQQINIADDITEDIVGGITEDDVVSSTEEKSGIVFNIQRFSVNDGPGIRTTVFLKGCSLSCGWCSNPEALIKSPQIITRDIKCIQCGKCVEVCDQQAISMVDNVRIVDWDKCNHCMRCTEVCPSGALQASGKQMTVAEVFQEIEKDSSYYQRTGGGLTVSGGESMVQWKFALALLKEAKERGLHTTLDTTGNTSWDKLDEVLNYVDVVLYDIKHLDSNKHQQATGVPNKPILKNLQKILDRSALKTGDKSGPAIWLRYPLIPEFNDSNEDREALCQFILGLKPSVDKVCLLPYQNYGEPKYAALGMDYPWEEKPTIEKAQVMEFKQQMESCGIEVSLGR